jgi:tripartite-type tricarboxylate transporter receptor subunit TctC
MKARAAVRWLLIALAAAALVGGSRAVAEPVADFYKGKIVKFVLSAGEGGGYGTYATVLLPYMERYIPGNPKIIIQHMQGAGGVVAANNLYNVLPRDGTVFALIHRGAVSTTPLYGAGNIMFDPTKFGWIGSMNSEVSLCASWFTTPVKTFADLKRYPIVVGSVGPGGDEFIFTNFIDNVFGAKMKLISGYNSGGAIDLAMERGETEGRCGWSWSTIITTKPAWIEEKKVRLLVQIGVAKHPDLPDVPLIYDFVKNEEQRQITDIIVSPQLMGRPLLAPPGLPTERLSTLRSALESSMKDPKFVEDAKKQNLEISYVSGERIEAMLKRLYAMPKPIVEEAAQAVAGRK